jgi:ribosomal protein S18 acetylase RimI-like enzyme
MDVQVKQYDSSDFDAAVSVLGDAFVTDSLHVAAFGPERLDQNQLFFRIGLEKIFTKHARVALVNGELHGYAHFAPSPSCLPPPDQVEAATTPILKPLGEAAPRVIQWLSSWCRHDPAEPHSHLGPIGVSPKVQGMGVGTALMNSYIDHLQTEGIAGYLETTSKKNVEFYRRFGFEVQREEEVIGTPNWYMWRPRPE